MRVLISTFLYLSISVFSSGQEVFLPMTDESYIECTNGYCEVIPNGEKSCSVYVDETLIHSEVYLVASLDDDIWIKTSPVNESDDYCYYYDYFGDWHSIFNPNLKLKESGYEYPVSWEGRKSNLIFDNGFSLLNNLGDVIYSVTHESGIYELLPEMYAFGNFDYEANQFEIDSLYLGKIDKLVDLKKQNLIAVLDSTLVFKKTINGLPYVAEYDHLMNVKKDWRKEDQYVRQLNLNSNNYSLGDLLENIAQEELISASIKRDIYYEHVQLSRIYAEDNIALLDVVFYPEEYNEYMINYRCYENPDYDLWIDKVYCSEKFYSVIIDEYVCEITGGPTVCGNNFTSINKIRDQDGYKRIYSHEIFTDFNSSEFQEYLTKKEEEFITKTTLEFQDDPEDYEFGPYLTHEFYLITQEGINFPLLVSMYYPETEIYGELVLSFEELKPFLKPEFYSFILGSK